MEDFYNILNNYLTAYEGALGRNIKRANDLRPNVERLQLNLSRFYFLVLSKRYSDSKGVFLKMLDLMRVAKLSPLRALTDVDIQKHFKG